MPSIEPGRLDSWKEIADHLKRTVRTVQRWEASEGMPVHRQVHQSLGNVFAYAYELDAWLANRHERPEATVETKPELPRRQWITGGVLGAALVLSSAWLLSHWTSRANGPVWLITTALDNRTGETLLDDSVTFLVEREIANSSSVHVASRARVEDSLVLMRKDPLSPLDEALAREICIRDGGIGIVVSSRAEHAGTGYALNVRVIEAASARPLANLSELARNREEVAPVAQRLGRHIRRIFGDRSASFSSGSDSPRAPYLRSCQFYSRAQREAGAGNWPAAEQLARQAVSEDPRFPLAHLWLAWTIWNQGRPANEFRPHVERALALTDLASERERQFIQATALLLQGEDQQAVAAYRRLLAAYPDHFWARWNLLIALQRLGDIRPADEWDTLVRLRPNSARILNLAVESMVFEAADVKQARRYRDRIRTLDQTNAAVLTPPTRRLLQWFRLHELLLGGKLEELHAETKSLASSGNNAAPLDRAAVLILFECMGRVHDADALLESVPQQSRDIETTLLAFLRDDNRLFRKALLASANVDYHHAPMLALLSIQPDRTTSKDRVLTNSSHNWKVPLWLPYALKCRRAILNGDLQLAVQEINNMHAKSANWATPEWLILTAALARAQERAGNDAAALALLTTADIGPAKLFNPWSRSVAFSHRIRYERARLLRKMQRHYEAEEIELGLRRDLRLADDDHPLLVRLNQSSRRPLSIY